MYQNLPQGILFFVLSFLLTVFFVAVLTPSLIRLGFTDTPSERKLHKGLVPVVGGIAIFLVMVLFTHLLLPPSSKSFGLLLASGLLALVGAIDDRFGISYKIRFLTQIVAALIVIFVMGNQLSSFGQLAPSVQVDLGVLALPITVLGIVAIINAFNLIDGIDGLAAGLAMVSFFALWILLQGQVSETSEFILIVLLGALLAYSLFNLHVFPRFTQKIFMGDAGSTLLGFVIVTFLVRFSQDTSAVFRPVTALWIVAVPLTDMLLTFLRRLRHGKNPFRPDRTHIHHIFQRARFSQPVTLFIILGWAAALSVIGIALDWLAVPDYWSFGLFLVTVALHAMFISYAWKISKLIYRRW